MNRHPATRFDTFSRLIASLPFLAAVNIWAACTPVPPNLISWWPAEGNANDIASTNNGTLQGGATASAPGEVGLAFTFDGTSSYVQIPDSPALRPTNLTIETWVRFRSLDSAGNASVGQQYLVFKQNTLSYNFEGYYLGKERRPGGDVFAFGVTSAAGVAVEADSGPIITTNVWYHIAAVRGPNFIQLYTNGQLAAQTSVSFAQNYGTLPLFFGSSGQSYWDRKLAGNLDEVSLYSRALTASEVAAIYAAGSAGKCQGAQAPGIQVPPQTQNVALGGNAVFSVTATGTAPLGYQWLFGGAPVTNGGQFSGAAGPTLTISNVQTANGGSYAVIVSNSVGSVTSSAALLNVLVPPAITAQPQSLTNVAGTTATFSAGASGSAPLTFQWKLSGVSLSNGGRISGANTTSLTISNVQPSDAGPYTLLVSNAVGTATSASATLTITGPPVITGQPANQNAAPGATASFSVSASGTLPLSYRWFFNGGILSDGGQFSGSGTPTLLISNVQPANVGGYSVVITNIAGAATSTAAMLSVTVAGNCAPAPLNLTSWWPGEGNANDIAGVNNGTLQGGATANATGEVGLAFTFDGTSGYVQIPDSPALRPTNLTIETWVRFRSLDSAGNASAGQQYLVFKQNTRSANFEGYYLGKERRTGGDVFAFGVSSAAGVALEADSAPMITTNVWYHIAAVRGPNFIQLYTNGQLAAQTSVSFPQDYGTLPLFFGSSGESYWDRKLAGNLDEVSFYNRALTGSEVAAVYAAGASGKCIVPTAPSIVTQPSSQTLVVGGTVSFSVTAAGTAPLSYQWSKDGAKLSDGGNITGSTNATLTIFSAQTSDIGNYQVRVTNNWGAVTSVVATLSSGVAPPNDAFAAAQVVSGSSGSVSGNNFSATKQAGEPNHAGNPGGASVWYTWTAPSTSPVTFDTALSAFDTLLAVYTGSSVSGLTLIASNNDMTTNCNRSRLTFTPVSGTVYRIAVDGANGATGNLTLRWAQASVGLPDLSVVGSAVNPQISTETFASSSCAVKEGLIQAGTRTIIRFSTETENSGTADLFFGNPANNPLFVWAPCHAHYHFNNYMSYRLRNANGQIVAIGLKVGFCILDVFRWKSGAPNNAKYTCSNQGIQVGWGDLYDSTLDGQWIDITGLPAGNYTIEIEANPQGIVQESNYANNITQVPISIGNPSAPPLNDNFASAQALLGGFSSVSGINVNATKQAGEPNHAGNVGGHSVWYQWTAPDTKGVSIDTLGSSFNTLLAAYTGSSLTALSVVASNDDIGPGNLQSQIKFSATAGQSYKIAVDGFNGATGNIVLTLDQTIQNDNFANPEFIGGVNGVAHGSNVGATKEAGEPNIAGNPGGASIWYAWTAPINGQTTFDTLGSTFDTLLGVYTGSAVNNLTNIASNDDIDQPNGIVQSRVTFGATGLMRYWIAIDGFNGATGDTTLNWNLVASANVAMSPDQQAPALAQPARATLACSFLPEGELQLAVAGLPLQSYRIERSCDLAHWTPLATTMADPVGSASFIDKSTMHLERQSLSGDPICGPGQLSGSAFAPRPMRFYRAIPVRSN